MHKYILRHMSSLSTNVNLVNIFRIKWYVEHKDMCLEVSPLMIQNGLSPTINVWPETIVKQKHENMYNKRMK
jgi:hypothetical protein